MVTASERKGSVVRRTLACLVLAAAVLTGVPAPAGAGVEETSSRSLAATPRLRVPKIGANAAMIPAGINARGELAVGTSVRDVYIWKHGVRPGQPGSAVLAGHTWSRGDGVFDRLGSMRRGNRFAVGRHRFRVTKVTTVRRLSRTQVRELFSDRGRPRVVLITCGDRSNTTGIYRSRILVYAQKI